MYRHQGKSNTFKRKKKHKKIIVEIEAFALKDKKGNARITGLPSQDILTLEKAVPK